ncbi:MAG: membrane protein insertase YidC [Bryobacteraceae bacterium]
MAESENSKPALKGPKKDIPIEQRLMLAFALMGLVLFVTQFLYQPPKPEDTVKPIKSATPQQAAKPAEPAAAIQQAPVSQVASVKEQIFSIETDLYKVQFSNYGAVVRSWQLKQYRDGTGRPLELVNSLASPKTHYPFSLLFESQKPTIDLNWVLFAPRFTADGLGIDFEYSNGRASATKTFRFIRDSYLTQVTSEVRENGIGIPHLLAWRGGFGDRSVAAAATLQRTMYFDVTANKLVENDVKVAKNGTSTHSGKYSFAGVEDTYFAAVFLPKDGREVKLQTLSDHAPVIKDAKEEALIGVGVGGDARNNFSLFVGPKDLDLLRKVDPKLEQAIDFGWFSILAKPLFLALNWMNDRYIRNYGWAIVLITILINFLLLPLKLSGMKSMRKMSLLQPEITVINDKYKGVGIRDPKKAEQNQEVMDLYKKHGVNPLGAGCLPMLLQIPFFIAFYKVLSVAIEMRGAQWLWVSDLSQPETIAIRILPIAMIGTQFILQKMTPNTSMDPAQQKMMLMMPLFMGFMFYGISSGLVLYWLTGNVVGIIQQWAINRFMPAAAPVAAKTVITKKIRK